MNNKLFIFNSLIRILKCLCLIVKSKVKKTNNIKMVDSKPGKFND